MTGCLAAYAFKNSVIHEYLETPNTHDAVLRFRSNQISELTGIPFKKVTVHKGIWHNGEFVQPTVRLMNLYSKKVTGGYYDRSISNIDSVVRYVAPADFHSRMLNHLGDRVIYGSDIEIDKAERPVISTLPLPILANKLGAEVDIPKASKAEPIYVSTVEIEDCELYQTVYVPDERHSVYRLSFTGNRLIIETVNPIHETYVDMVLQNVFGIFEEFKVIEMNKEQKLGKFVPLDEDYRKRLMFDITQHHGIYSLGRHATWRKVLLDDVYKDITKIERMIKHSAYDLMIGNV